MHKVGIQAQAAADGDNHLGGDSCVDGTLHNVHRQQLNHRHQTALDKHELENVRHVVISQECHWAYLKVHVLLGLCWQHCHFISFLKVLLLEAASLRLESRRPLQYSWLFFFTITTPASIGAGIAISSFYNVNSPQGVIIEGVFDSISAGILIYMALVSLIASDFLSEQMRSDRRKQALSYLSIFLGAMVMSSLALWA
ncbi:hypothetical protein O6H91_07G091900 [Diphasiastrum complanatum]|uniref:Uncharacterized protein n=1 Tax=Diphasiastrum complanatum TaxID=34168 RepID=A0ACC2D7U3_DIPCM|nr:hypothetical protein O6H91_07G091900 [Diphasiastrum complanatum]